MPVHDDLGIRMKTNYENIPKMKLMRREPVIIRIDGKAFHTFTRGFKKPFDHNLMDAMQLTMKRLCENIQGCVLGYCQSDEISLLLVDYEKLETDAFFDYEVQKLCSVSASMATLYFGQSFCQNIEVSEAIVASIDESYELSDDYDREYLNKLADANDTGAMFDSRCFNIPKEEVTNYFYWRQLDAIRNSVQMVGRANFSHKELQGKSCNDIKDMLYDQKGIRWENLPTKEQRGSCCVKKSFKIDGENWSAWCIDNGIPVFVGDGREYIDKLVFVG